MTINAQNHPSSWKGLLLISLSPSKSLEQFTVGLLPLPEALPPLSWRKSLDSGRLQGMGFGADWNTLQNLSATPRRMSEEGCKNVPNNLTAFQTFPSLTETTRPRRDLQKENKYWECGLIVLFWDHEIFLLLCLAVTLRRRHQSRGRNLWADILPWKWKGDQGAVKCFCRRSGILAACSKPSLARLQGCVIPAIRVPRCLGPPIISCSSPNAKLPFFSIWKDDFRVIIQQWLPWFIQHKPLCVW